MTDVNDQSDQPIASYEYDYQGRRVIKTIHETQTTTYCYDGDQVIAEYDGSDNLLRKFVYGSGIDEPVCMIVVDGETGNYYYRARYYAPDVGRFLQTDPIRYANGLNLYTYCGNNPTNWVDPYGDLTLPWTGKHRNRNRHNLAHSTRAGAEADPYWKKEEGNIFHSGRDTYRGYGPFKGSQASYFPSDPNECVLDRKNTPYDINDLDIWVIGFKDDLPSGLGCITLSENGTAQQELGGIPFKNGIAPNWESWDTNNVRYSNFASLAKKEFVPSKKRYHNIEKKSDKPYSQILKTSAGGGTLGVYRKFLGLVPGHTYRLSARLNTFDMDPNVSNWSFSLHVAYNSPNGEDLTKEQLAGLAALPNGKKGLEAAQVVSYGQGKTTNGKFVEHSTEFTLPDGVNTITVWPRLSGSSAISGVGFDWIKLEDLSMTADKSTK